ncbi:MAG TPA: PaaI family thioesterase [Bdellovibrio sp.]|uniref:PaaI family thioesterase n=1 Tax=Bdellovibrio sp. TaxID=28201 RepID=UPI002EEA45F7
MSHLQYDKSLQIQKPYIGDDQGAFVLGSNQLEMVLIKSNKHHELLAEVWFSRKSTGPPGHVHGGCQAAVLDEMMGATGWKHGFSVVAAKIEVEFLNMIPVEKQYQVRGQIVSQDKRKIFIEAEIFSKEKIYAKSKGLFIVLTPEQLTTLDAERNKQN